MPVTEFATQEDFSTEVRIALIRKGWSITQLAHHLGYARNTVSLAINHGLFKDVCRRIREELGL